MTAYQHLDSNIYFLIQQLPNPLGDGIFLIVSSQEVGGIGEPRENLQERAGIGNIILFIQPVARIEPRTHWCSARWKTTTPHAPQNNPLLSLQHHHDWPIIFGYITIFLPKRFSLFNGYNGMYDTIITYILKKSTSDSNEGCSLLFLCVKTSCFNSHPLHLDLCVLFGFW